MIHQRIRLFIVLGFALMMVVFLVEMSCRLRG